MKQRKKSANWYVAATHYLTAGFAPSFIAGLIWGFGIEPLVETLDLPVLTASIFWVIQFLVIWLGIMYSARYLRGAYVIIEENKNKIVRLSTIYFAVITAPFILLGRAAIFGPFGLILVVAAIILFHLLSRKYVPVTSEESA